jgi:hypothetical protein
MMSKPEGQGETPAQREPPKRRPIIIRIFLGLKRHEHRRRRRTQQEKSDRDLIMARWTRRVGIFTAALVVVGVVTGGIFWRQLNVMQGQLDEMRSEQRPWVTIIKDPPDIISPLTYRSGVVSINLLFTFRNVGHLPAFGVIPSSFAIPHTLVRTGGEFAHACNFRNPDIGIYVFPSDDPPPTQPVSIVISQPELEAFWERYSKFRIIIAPVIFVCVVYWESGSSKPHHTPFAYEVFRKHSDNPKRPNASIFLDEGDVPEDNLFLRRQIAGVPPPD